MTSLLQHVAVNTSQCSFLRTLLAMYSKAILKAPATPDPRKDEFPEKN